MNDQPGCCPAQLIPRPRPLPARVATSRRMPDQEHVAHSRQCPMLHVTLAAGPACVQGTAKLPGHVRPADQPDHRPTPPLRPGSMAKAAGDGPESGKPHHDATPGTAGAGAGGAEATVRAAGTHPARRGQRRHVPRPRVQLRLASPGGAAMRATSAAQPERQAPDRPEGQPAAPWLLQSQPPLSLTASVEPAAALGAIARPGWPLASRCTWADWASSTKSYCPAWRQHLKAGAGLWTGLHRNDLPIPAAGGRWRWHAATNAMAAIAHRPSRAWAATETNGPERHTKTQGHARLRRER